MNRCNFVSRHFYFWNDLHVVTSREGNKVPHFLLCVVARNLQRHIVHAHAVAAQFRQQRIGFDFHAPGLVVHEM